MVAAVLPRKDRPMNTKTAFLLPVLATAALAIAGCGSDSSSSDSTSTAADTTTTAAPAAAAPLTSVDMAMSEFKFAPDTVTVAAGKVPITQKNTGAVVHEFVLLKSDKPADSFAVKNGQINEEDVGTNVGEIEDVAPGKSKSKTFDLKPGKYVFICNLSGHYEGGMYGSMVVQ
jgi:uncharacterized cupredoxin-like copper-binding protein